MKKEKTGKYNFIEIAGILLANLLITLFLDVFLEWTFRKSFDQVLLFIRERTFVFLYNGLIIFVTLSLVLIFKKRIFAYALVIGSWLLVGIANAVILINRKTPFTAVDLTLVKSILPIIRVYISTWQIVLVLIAIVACITFLVCLFLYTPEMSENFDARANSLVLALIICILMVCTYIGVGRKQLIGKFDNLINGYQDYGVAFGFCVTAIDTGIDRPIDYSADKVERLCARIDKKVEKLKKQEGGDARRPDIIFIQLESFFDVTTVKGLTFSEDPMPNIRRLQKDYRGGWLKVPVYGAGTVNTEFEVMTGMNLDDFGTGEYPYRSILHRKTCDNINYWLKDSGYVCSVIHNNNASFYDRDKVFANLGVDYFLSMENMDIREENDIGWAKDKVLADYILDTLRQTPGRDFIYAISVQGHGDYPDTDQTGKRIRVRGEENSFTTEQVNQYTYYANESYEMDAFIGDLISSLEDYPDDVMVVAYGDHLPGMNLKSSDLTSGSKYKTPYFIWDNFGSSRAKSGKMRDLEAWQIGSEVLGQVGIHHGVLNAFHQTMSAGKNYKKNLRLLSYDILYGSDFSHRGEAALKPTTIRYCLVPVSIKAVRTDEEEAVIEGERFTAYSRVRVNGRRVRTEFVDSGHLKIPAANLKKENEILVEQVSDTSEKIVFNQSEPFLYQLPEEER